MSENTEPKSTRRPRKMAREPETEVSTAEACSTDKPISKSAQVLAMLQRPEGATLEQMVAATSWLPHTTRAALTGLKRKGHAVTSGKVDGVRTYHVVTNRDAA